MDAFFAAIEQRDHPELRGKPIAVGGSHRRGVVAAASYEARQYGVRSAMPGMIAKRKCPQLIFVKHRFDVYREVSRQIREIFTEYTDLIEPLSLDEAFLDVTENKKDIPSATEIAEVIRQQIFKQTRLTASAGVSFNKFLAKIASDINKPDGIKVITPKMAIPFLEALPIEKFFGIGKVTAKRMHRMGIYTGKDLKALDEIDMYKRFGKAGRHFYKIVRAEDHRPVKPERRRKSIGAERTFMEDQNDFKSMWEKLEPIAQKVFDQMEKNENFGRTVHLKMKTPAFQIYTRSKTFNSAVDNRTLFVHVVEDLLREYWETAGTVRLLGVSVSNLNSEWGGEGVQLRFDF